MGKVFRNKNEITIKALKEPMITVFSYLFPSGALNWRHNLKARFLLVPALPHCSLNDWACLDIEMAVNVKTFSTHNTLAHAACV